MELRESLVLLLPQMIHFLLLPVAQGQLDLPNMPGPPYPDPRGQNRWGVKFDPRKHGPPFDKRGHIHRSVYRRPPPPTSPGREEEENGVGGLAYNNNMRSRGRDLFWSPNKMRSHHYHHHHHQGDRRHMRRSRYYGKDLKGRRPPRSYMQTAHKETQANKRPHLLQNKPEEKHQEFWKVWNAWYARQMEAKKKVKSGHSLSHQEEFTQQPQNNDDDGRSSQNSVTDTENTTGWRWKGRRSSVLNGMREMYKKARNFAFEEEQDQEQEKSAEQKSESTEQWGLFTTIGKGLDAANDIRKSVGGSILETGMKYGGKLALDAVLHAGSNALSTVIQSTAPFG